MNETQPPTLQIPEPQVPEAPETQSIAKQKSLADRILALCVLGSVVVNLGWLAWVSNSDLFGSAASLSDLKPQLIKIVKPPIPQKPKPKKKEPPPPPPKQKPPPPKQRPLKPPPPRPHPVPHRITPPLHRVQVATTHNTRAVSTITVPQTAPNTDQRPTASGDSVLPTPTHVDPTPPVVHNDPTPVVRNDPPPVVHNDPPPVVHTDPPPVVHHDPPKPKGWVPIETQEATAPDNLDVSADGIESGSTTSNEIVISYTIDESGHIKGARITKSSGNSELDRRVLEALRRARCQPAVQDHIPRESHEEYHFPVG